MHTRSLIGLVLILVLSACGGMAGDVTVIGTVEAPPTAIPFSDADADAMGAAIYTENCADCHGADGTGNGVVAIDAGFDVPDFTARATTAEQSFNQWTNTIRYGRIDNMMPPWDNALTDEEIQAVGEYTFTLWQDDDARVAQSNTESDSPHANSDTAYPEATAQPMPETIGNVTGTVVNGTEGSTLPETLSVALHIMDAEMREVDYQMQVLTSTDEFVFEDIALRPDRTYMITAIHNDALFYSSSTHKAPADGLLDLSVTVYDVTNDPSVIELDLLVTRVIDDNGELVFQQIMSFHNTSDRLYRGENQINSFTYESVRVPLPEGATLLNQADLVPRFLMLEDTSQQTLLDTEPVLPNSEHMVEVVYTLPPEQAASIELPILYDMANEAEVMMENEGYQVVSEQLVQGAMQDFHTGQYDSYTGAMLSAGETLTYQVQAVATAADARQQRNTLVLAMGVVGAGLMVTSGGAFIWHQRNPSRDELLERLATLDDRYERGDISQADYERKRARLKQKLARIMQADTK